MFVGNDIGKTLYGPIYKCDHFKKKGHRAYSDNKPNCRELIAALKGNGSGNSGNDKGK